ncbi:MAG TPA: homoserine kinase [Dermatophilaceae bacterium]|nr:homoserine kinase [Dermatophilaceae bacterium]
MTWSHLIGQGVRVVAPGSSANLGPGFDSVGLALALYDRYVVRLADTAGLVVTVSGQDADQVPLDERHLVYRSFLRGMERQGVLPPEGIRLDCVNGVPQGRGLGSSATAIVAGVAAAYGLVRMRDGAPWLDRGAVNDLASEIEGHPDNASASVYGGLTVSYVEEGGGRVHTVRPDVHPDVVPLVLLPDAVLATSTARAVLPAHVPHGEAALNSARAALLVHALTSDPALLLPATREWLHQEQRRAAFPASMALVDRLRAAGHAAVISGAGPSVLVLGTAASTREVPVCPGWRHLTVGMSRVGVAVDRVTLNSHLAEVAGDPEH